MTPAARSGGLPADAVEVGRIVGAWGLAGWIRIAPHAREGKALHASPCWYLLPGDAPRPAGAPPLPPLLHISASRKQGDAVLAAARELADRDAALTLRGARVFVSRSSFPPAGDDEYYWVDLIGLAVVNRAGEALGTVVDLIDTGAHAVLRLQCAGAPAAQAERLIPFVGAYVDRVDLEARRIVVDWGLDY